MIELGIFSLRTGRDQSSSRTNTWAITTLYVTIHYDFQLVVHFLCPMWPCMNANTWTTLRCITETVENQKNHWTAGHPSSIAIQRKEESEWLSIIAKSHLRFPVQQSPAAGSKCSWLVNYTAEASSAVSHFNVCGGVTACPSCWWRLALHTGAIKWQKYIGIWLNCCQ